MSSDESPWKHPSADSDEDQTLLSELIAEEWEIKPKHEDELMDFAESLKELPD